MPSTPTLIVATALTIGAACGVAALFYQPTPEPEPKSAVVEVIPPCTDDIADHGGICQGPLITPTPQPTDLPPCPTEDSDNCYWDADVRGDGRGKSFITEHGTTTYDDGTVVTWPVD